MTLAAGTALYRYPVKGLSPEALPAMVLLRGEGLTHDRKHALALGTTEFDPAAPAPLAKTNFLMLARNEALAQLATKVDTATGVLTVAYRDGTVAVMADLATMEGRTAVEDFFTAFAGEAARGRIRVVSAARHRFTDIGAPAPAMMDCISLINLSSLRVLEEAMGRTLDPLRFRANVYVDGLPAWSEFDLIERSLAIGPIPFRAVRRTRRCPATNVNPATAERDADVPRALREHFGHTDLGVYLEVMGDGTLNAGDAIRVPA